MNKLILAVLFFTLCSSCNNENKTVSKDIQKDNIAEVFSDDEEMNNAIKKAKETFKDFDTAYYNGHFTKEDFSVKVKFEIENGGEHIWANNITYEYGSYYGIIDEDATATNEVKMGDKVKITIDNLSDWLYNDNGILKGGYTIKVLRNKMSEEEKAQFDSTFSLKIID